MEGEQPYLGDLLTMVIKHLLIGMILQATPMYFRPWMVVGSNNNPILFTGTFQRSPWAKQNHWLNRVLGAHPPGTRVSIQHMSVGFGVQTMIQMSSSFPACTPQKNSHGTWKWWFPIGILLFQGAPIFRWSIFVLSGMYDSQKTRHQS